MVTPPAPPLSLLTTPRPACAAGDRIGDAGDLGDARATREVLGEVAIPAGIHKGWPDSDLPIDDVLGDAAGLPLILNERLKADRPALRGVAVELFLSSCPSNSAAEGAATAWLPGSAAVAVLLLPSADSGSTSGGKDFTRLAVLGTGCVAPAAAGEDVASRRTALAAAATASSMLSLPPAMKGSEEAFLMSGSNC